MAGQDTPPSLAGGTLATLGELSVHPHSSVPSWTQYLEELLTVADAGPYQLWRHGTRLPPWQTRLEEPPVRQSLRLAGGSQRLTSLIHSPHRLATPRARPCEAEGC